MEIFDIVDEHGVPTGETVERNEAHALGIRHRTAHVWIVRKHENRTEILLQKRCAQKDSFPNCYDISSAGHIPAGVDYVPSALRELEEELGVKAEAKDLVLCGQRNFSYSGVFHNRPFRDNQVSNIYVLTLNREAEDFTLQKEEISEVRWMDIHECIRAVNENSIPNCIYPEELDMVLHAVIK